MINCDFQKGNIVFFTRPLSVFLPYTKVSEFLLNSSTTIPAGDIAIFLGRSEMFEDFGAKHIVGKWIHVLHEDKILWIADTDLVHIKRATDSKHVARLTKELCVETPL